MKPERTQFLTGPSQPDAVHVRFTAGGTTLEPAETRILVGGVAMKPERTQLGFQWSVFQPERLRKAFEQVTSAVRLFASGHFLKSFRTFRSGIQELSGILNDLVEVEVSLVPLGEEK